jgi:hypothetical protein
MSTTVQSWRRVFNDSVVMELLCMIILAILPFAAAWTVSVALGEQEHYSSQSCRLVSSLLLIAMWICKAVCRKHINCDEVVEESSILTFTVDMLKLEGVPLGAALRNEKGSAVISAISASGGIQAWNDHCPENEIRLGDKIVAVNASNVDFWSMLNMLWSVGEISLTIERDRRKKHKVCRRKSRVFLAGLPAESIKLHCPVDDLPHMSVGDCSGTECAICFEDYEDLETRVVVLPCNHVFHPVCTARWFSQGSWCCPLCKHCIGLNADDAGEDPLSLQADAVPMDSES